LSEIDDEKELADMYINELTQPCTFCSAQGQAAEGESCRGTDMQWNRHCRGTGMQRDRQAVDRHAEGNACRGIDTLSDRQAVDRHSEGQECRGIDTHSDRQADCHKVEGKIGRGTEWQKRTYINMRNAAYVQTK